MDISFSEAKGMFGTAIDLMKKGSQIEAQAQAQAQAQIQELQEKYLELHAENLELKQALIEVKNKIYEKENMVYEEPFFYTTKGDEKEGPFCPRCWQKDDKKCRVVPTPESYSGSSKCQVCDQNFGKGRSVHIPEVRTRRT